MNYRIFLIGLLVLFLVQTVSSADVATGIIVDYDLKTEDGTVVDETTHVFAPGDKVYADVTIKNTGGVQLGFDNSYLSLRLHSMGATSGCGSHYAAGSSTKWIGGDLGTVDQEMFISNVGPLTIYDQMPTDNYRGTLYWIYPSRGGSLSTRNNQQIYVENTAGGVDVCKTEGSAHPSSNVVVGETGAYWSMSVKNYASTPFTGRVQNVPNTQWDDDYDGGVVNNVDNRFWDITGLPPGETISNILRIDASNFDVPGKTFYFYPYIEYRDPPVTGGWRVLNHYYPAFKVEGMFTRVTEFSVDEGFYLDGETGELRLTIRNDGTGPSLPDGSYVRLWIADLGWSEDIPTGEVPKGTTKSLTTTFTVDNVDNDPLFNFRFCARTYDNNDNPVRMATAWSASFDGDVCANRNFDVTPQGSECDPPLDEISAATPSTLCTMPSSGVLWIEDSAGTSFNSVEYVGGPPGASYQTPSRMELGGKTGTMLVGDQGVIFELGYKTIVVPGLELSLLSLFILGVTFVFMSRRLS